MRSSGLPTGIATAGRAHVAKKGATSRAVGRQAKTGSSTGEDGPADRPTSGAQRRGACVEPARGSRDRRGAAGKRRKRPDAVWSGKFKAGIQPQRLRPQRPAAFAGLRQTGFDPRVDGLEAGQGSAVDCPQAGRDAGRSRACINLGIDGTKAGCCPMQDQHDCGNGQRNCPRRGPALLHSQCGDHEIETRPGPVTACGSAKSLIPAVAQALAPGRVSPGDFDVEMWGVCPGWQAAK